MKTIKTILEAPKKSADLGGMPIRTLASYNKQGADISPFLLFDFAGPIQFEPTDKPSGVDKHPHRGFETVTIVYDGEIAHRDSTGNSGTIGPGDIQWMTAGSGIIHEEYQSPKFSRTGGKLLIVQLWVNLPAKNKMSPAAYQEIKSSNILNIDLDNDAGQIRLIAGEFNGQSGAAQTFTPINVWDLHLKAGKSVNLPIADGHTTSIIVISGEAVINDSQKLSEAGIALMSQDGKNVTLSADEDAIVLILTGEPINEPIVGRGPFVMNTSEEIHQAIHDYNSGAFNDIH